MPNFIPLTNDQNTNTMQITSYEAIEDNGGLQVEDKFLLARYANSTGDYYNVSWNTIKQYIDTKATAIKNNFGDVFGIVSVNEDGIVNLLRSIEEQDLPQINISKIINLQDTLDNKVNIDFANSTNNYLIGAISNSIDTVNNELSITYSYISPSSDNPKKDEVLTVLSSDNSLMFASNERGIDITVNGDNVQVQSDWNQTDDTKVDYIKNKPNLNSVATSGSYKDLSDKPQFVSSNDTTLSINFSENNNTYTFNAIPTAQWGQIFGDIETQDDLRAKFEEYYTSEQVDQLIADLSTGLLKVVGYISNEEPTTLFPDKIVNGILWLQSTASGSPNGQTFACKVYNESTSSWDNTTYTAKDFDVWMNVNGTENSWFWLGQIWEKLDFNVDMSNYYNKSDVDGLLSKKQNNISGTAGNVVVITNTPGVVSEAKLADVAYTGSFNDLSDKPQEQIQSDWDQTNDTKVDYIKNKPSASELQANWNETNQQSYGYIKNKPIIPELVQSDWTENNTTSYAYIRHKPNPSYAITSKDVVIGSHLFDGSRKSFDIAEEAYDYLDSIQLYYNGLRLVNGVDYTCGFNLNPLNLSVGQSYDYAILKLDNIETPLNSSWAMYTSVWNLICNSTEGSLVLTMTTTGETINLISNNVKELSSYNISDQFVITSIEGTVPEILYSQSGAAIKTTFAPDLSTDTLMYSYFIVSKVSDNITSE